MKPLISTKDLHKEKVGFTCWSELDCISCTKEVKNDGDLVRNWSTILGALID
jgi:hypothetical protein